MGKQPGATLIVWLRIPDADADLDVDVVAREIAAMVNEERARNGGPGRDSGCVTLHRSFANAALARLSRPDVLDEFERRLLSEFQTYVDEDAVDTACRVLADMLGGES